tara:strand:- start:21 stop:455 length:435 start_codon:yes stop_codon:yes gene_type:complete
MPVYKDNAQNRKLDRVGKTYGKVAAAAATLVAAKKKVIKKIVVEKQPVAPPRLRRGLKKTVVVKQPDFKPPKSWTKFYNDADSDDLFHIIDIILGGEEDAEKSPKLTKQHTEARKKYSEFIKTQDAKTANSETQLAKRFRTFME